MDLNYYQTLIAVADDCPVAASEVPRPRGGRPTVAVVQYELLVADPYRYTQEDVLFESWLARRDGQWSPAEVARLREEFFARPQACLRSSPLPKRHGWGLLFDDRGRIALCAMESDEYARLISAVPPPLKVLKALRTRRPRP
ncbi:hypothetical protein SAMN05444365_101275 [Micromonospora pattaloongensis]|uniref:Uncharacterized protein n=1 Tax=Micromonospora pattaloongensis TaxID=405436 RepID=A0A1H3G686_9ACTN|nr:DUF6157 family protein [Micromonospora pattaloongensis]SDX97974.1 hypothetical protein SAMN05444365_101275 [Micromonospora pattaloongensis]